MIGAAAIRPLLAAHLPPDQLDRAVELVAELTDRLSALDYLTIMGELMNIQALVSSDMVAAAERARQLAERFDAHELATFLSELASPVGAD